jgi:hypothetical protein
MGGTYSSEVALTSGDVFSSNGYPDSAEAAGEAGLRGVVDCR